jgi:hypothetical protein
MNEPDPTPTPDDDVDRTNDFAALTAAAKKRCLALRAAEGERDALAARLDATHRAQIEAAAADRLHDPADLWAVTSVDEMRGDDGLIDREKAEAAMNAVLEQKPHWRRAPAEPGPEPEPFPAVHQGPRSSPEPPAPSFGAQLKDSLRGRR